MKCSEFSDMFDTLLNSYASQAIFGEGAAKSEVVLDEYEKSVLLTQAQDIITKSYFERNSNPQGTGFDDTIRRQVDFSSLIKTATLVKADNQDSKFDDRGIIYYMPRRRGTTVTTTKDAQTGVITTTVVSDTTDISGSTDVLFILNEKMIYRVKSSEDVLAEYVVVPLNYKEYDREMSKAYAQPFKKQAWRLFQNQATTFDVQSELIPLWNISKDILDDESLNELVYRIRYVKRPDPIVLVDLPNGLSIDGFTEKTECTLNPIVHMDILNKAVEIALSTRGRVAAPSRNQE